MQSSTTQISKSTSFEPNNCHFVPFSGEIPECGLLKIATILYGLLSYSNDLRMKLKNNEIVFGDCCITGNDQSWQCINCGTDIFIMKVDQESSPD